MSISRFQTRPRPWSAQLAAKLSSLAWFILSTLLMLELREALDAATEGDRADAAYKRGL
ncbi:MAG: hypothetical protein ACJ8HI_18620 [Massilia sp.]